MKTGSTVKRQSTGKEDPVYKMGKKRMKNEWTEQDLRQFVESSQPVFQDVSLTQVDEGGDFAFEGEITNYTSTTSSVSSDEYALLNRLTITVKVRFTNALDESMSFNRTFTAFEDYESTQLLTEVEGTLIPLIVDKLVTDIFQASASNW